jgi:hypothetical protein
MMLSRSGHTYLKLTYTMGAQKKEKTFEEFVPLLQPLATENYTL